EARKLLQPSKIRPGHVPNWFRLACLRGFRGQIRRDDMDGGGVVQKLQDLVPHLNLDHDGSLQMDGRTVYVAEPYCVSAAEIVAGKQLADTIGCQFIVSSNSWHYPGQTIRLIWSPTDEQARNAKPKGESEL